MAAELTTGFLNRLARLLVLCVALPGAVSAADITVGGACSLAEAIENANDGAATHADCEAGQAGIDTIRLAVDVTLDVPLPVVTSEILILGEGLTVRRNDGASPFRILEVESGGELTLHDTTISNGLAADFTIAYGGGILNSGILTLHGSTVSGNSADGGTAVAGGGGISNSGTATLIGSTVSNNTVLTTGVGGHIGGGILNSGTLTLIDTTVSNNVAGSVVSGLFEVAGGGIANLGGTAALENSTVSGNQVQFGSATGGGIHNTSGGSITLTNSTVTGNSAVLPGALEENGGGLYNAEGSVTLANTVLSENVLLDPLNGSLIRQENCYTVPGAMTISSGGNLTDDNSCDGVPDTLTGLDPILADNGGPTLTHALLPWSNAIDHAGDCGLAADQRGNPRDEGACDSGAFERTCYPPYSDYLLLEMDTVIGDELYEVCSNLAAENDYIVAGTGDLTLRSGRSVVLGDGFSIESGGVLTVEIDPDLQMPPRPKIVFLTSDAYLGALGGLAGADEKCDERAAAAGRTGTFKAWLSDLSCGPADSCRNFTKASVPYIRSDGVRIADDWADLVTSVSGGLDPDYLRAAINLDEFGNPTSTFRAWTSTLADGSPLGQDTCLNWDSPYDHGAIGSPDLTTEGWTNSAQVANCLLTGRLYCFEQ